jgi:hypothetical protein
MNGVLEEYECFFLTAPRTFLAPKVCRVQRKPKSILGTSGCNSQEESEEDPGYLGV